MQSISTQDVVNDLLNVLLGPNTNGRQRYLLEQSLQNLVRVAKAEQRVEIKASVKKLTGTLTANLARSNVTPRN